MYATLIILDANLQELLNGRHDQAAMQAEV